MSTTVDKPFAATSAQMPAAAAAKPAARAKAAPVRSAKPAAKASAKAKTKAVAKTPTKAAAKAVAKPVVKAKSLASKAWPKAPAKPVAKPVAKTKVVAAADKAAKPKKPKLVRDSFTIPKLEYAVLDQLKQRATKLAQPVKKSELLRAGIKALAAMADAALLAALKAVPAIKTGRPKN